VAKSKAAARKILQHAACLVTHRLVTHPGDSFTSSKTSPAHALLLTCLHISCLSHNPFLFSHYMRACLSSFVSILLKSI